MASTLKPTSLCISSDDDEPDGLHSGSRTKIPSGMMSPGMALYNKAMTPKGSASSLLTPRSASPRSLPRSPRSPKMIIKALKKKASTKELLLKRPQIPTGKKKADNQQRKSVDSTGRVRFVHSSRLWGKITLNTVNKWGEKEVWFHVDACHARRMPMQGDDVDVKYIYSRARGLRALSVIPRTKSRFSTNSRFSSARDWRSGTSHTSSSNQRDFASLKKKFARNPGDYASFKTRKRHPGVQQSSDRQTSAKQSPAKATYISKRLTPDKRRKNKLPKNLKPASAKTARTVSSTGPKNSPNVRVAKGPAPNGQRGFRFNRSV